jgi:hypothetical protein
LHKNQRPGADAPGRFHGISYKTPVDFNSTNATRICGNGRLFGSAICDTLVPPMLCAFNIESIRHGRVTRVTPYQKTGRTTFSIHHSPNRRLAGISF